MMIRILIALGLAFASLHAEPMPISPLWKSPEFQRVLTGSYGIDSRVEPMITVDEEEYIRDAAKLMAAGNREGAIALYEGASIRADSPALTFSLANLKFEAGQTEEAIELFEQAIETFPNFRDALRNLAMARIQLGEVLEAEPHLIRAIELGARDGISLGMLGYCHAIDEDFQASLQAYRQAQITMPDEVQWKLGEAQALSQLGETGSAIALYRQILRDLPTDRPVWLNLAYALRQSDARQDAIAALEVLDAMEPLGAEESMVLGHLYLAEELPGDALTAYEASMTKETPPSFEQALEALRYLGDREFWPEAEVLLAAVLATYPEGKVQPGLRRMTALIEFERGDPEKAIVDIQTLVTEDPLDGQALLILGRFLRSKARHVEAEMAFEQASLLKDHAADAFLEMGRLKVEQGDYEGAIVKLERAQAIDPKPSVATYLAAVRDLAK